jgi:hypothetical protein
MKDFNMRAYIDIINEAHPPVVIDVAEPEEFQNNGKKSAELKKSTATKKPKSKSSNIFDFWKKLKL